MNEISYMGGPRRPPLPIIEFEALDSYIARFAAREKLSSTFEITGKIGLSYGHLADVTLYHWEKMPALAAMLGIDVLEIQQRCYPVQSGNIYRRSFFGCEVHRKDIDLRTRHFSPATFRNSAETPRQPAHIPAISQIRLFPFCVTSWEYLKCQCYRCGAIQRWHHSNGVDRCDQCVADLSKSHGTAVPVELRDNLEAAVGLIHPDANRRAMSLAKLAPELRDEGSSAAFELLVRLIPVVDNTMPRHRQKITQGISAERLTAAVAAAWELITDWPKNFDRFAAALVAARPSRKGDGNNGATTNFLRSAHHSPQIVPRSMHHIFTKYDATASGVGPSDTLTVRETASILGMSTTHVIDRRRAGGLKPRFCLIGKRALPLYDRPEVEMLRILMGARRSISSLSGQFGISIQGCEQLAAVGLLTPILHPFFALQYKELQIEEASVASLIGRLERCTTLPATKSGLVSLASAAKVIGGRLKPWGPIFAALINGKIPFGLANGEGPLVRRIRIHATALPTLAGLQFDPDTYWPFACSSRMTRKDAGELLNLHPRDCTGLFKSMEVGGRASTTDLAIDIAKRMAARFISASELWRRTGLSPQNIAHRALFLKIDHCFAGYDRRQAEAALVLDREHELGAPPLTRKARS